MIININDKDNRNNTVVVQHWRVSEQFFFFYETYFNYKPHKQNNLANIQPNIYKKGI